MSDECAFNGNKLMTASALNLIFADESYNLLIRVSHHSSVTDCISPAIFMNGIRLRYQKSTGEKDSNHYE